MSAPEAKHTAGRKVSRAEQRLRNAMTFLRSHGESLRSIAPPGEGDVYATAHFWFREPSYCWENCYGDFQPGSLRAGITRGLIEQDGHRPAYRITDAGRSYLDALDEDAALLADGNARYSEEQREEIAHAAIAKASSQQVGL